MGTYANTFVVHKKDGNQHKFIQSTWGLYYCDVSDNSKKNDFVLVNTVAENEKDYSKKDVRKAYKSRNFQQTIGNVSTTTLLQIVDNHELKNCPITREHVRVAEDILGPDIQSLQGKTSRKTPSAVDPPKVSSLPTLIKLKYVTVILCADIIIFNGVQFFYDHLPTYRFRDIWAYHQCKDSHSRAVPPPSQSLV